MLIVYFKVNYNINVQTFCKFLASLKLFVLLVHFILVIFVLHGTSGSLNSSPIGTFFFFLYILLTSKKKKKKKR